MNFLEIILSPLCGAIGLGLAILYHLLKTRKIRHNFKIQLELLQNTPIGLVYIQNDRVFVNKTFCLMLGVKRPSRWKDFLNLFPDNIQDILTTNCQTIKTKNASFEETISLEKRTFSVQGYPFNKKTLVLWWTDITIPQKKVEKEEQKNKTLSKQKELLENAWETLPFPAFIRSPDQKSLFANNAVGQKAQTINALHWISRPFKIKEKMYTLTYGQETHTEEEVQSLIREVANAHQRLCRELPCAICLFGANGKMMSCSKAFSNLWCLDEKWLKSNPNYEDFWDKIQEKGLMNRVMDFAQYKKQQRNQFAQISETQEVFLYLPNGKIIRRLMIPFASGSVILLDEDKTVN